jgi:DNA polymerase-3 subunit gamma/tau
MLLKGLAEVQQAARPIAAAEMLLVRIAYAADLPTPDEVIRSLGEDGGGATPRPQGNGGGMTYHQSGTGAGLPSKVEAPRGAPRASAAPVLNPVARLAEAAPHDAQPAAFVIGRFEDLVTLATERRDLQVKTALERDVRLVRCEDGRLEIALEPSAAKTLVNDLSRKISAWTGRQWVIVLSREPGAPTLRQQAEARDAELKSGVRGDPLVQAVLEKFPGAEIVSVRSREEDIPPSNAELAPEEDDFYEDDR